MEWIRSGVHFLNQFFSGPIMVSGIAAIGLLLTWRTRAVQVRRLGAALAQFPRQLRRPRTKGGVSPFQAVAAALSGTLGTGNIAGTAAAVALGGAGAVFWMWISAFLGMAVKYGEITLAMAYRRKQPDGSWLGGPMYYMEAALGGRGLASVFAVFCLLSSFCMGNLVQSNTAAAAAAEITGLSSRGIAVLFAGIAVLVGGVILGGIRRIARVTEALVPAMALFYLGGCAMVLAGHLPEVPEVFAEIFREAFSLRSAAAGAGGWGMAQAVKIGFSRGIFTNEAGLGSAPIAHATAENDLPARQGLWGIFEVFLDTIVMCTLTAVVILLSGLHRSGSLNGAALTLGAFQMYLGPFAALLTGISTVFFALAAVIGWAWYGEVCVRYLWRGERAVKAYKVCYVLAVWAGAWADMGIVWGLADLCNGLMLLPNLAALALLSPRVAEETHKLDQTLG